jgi:tetratricopeptide (TPR) repeat protein
MEQDDEVNFFSNNFESLYDTVEKEIKIEQDMEPLNFQKEFWFLDINLNFEELNEENQGVLKSIIEHYYFIGDYQKSFQFCEIFLKNFKNSSVKNVKEMLENCCRVLFKCKKYQETVDLMEDSKCFNRPPMLKLKANCFMEMKDYNSAIKLLQESILLSNSKNSSFLKDLSECYLEIERNDLSSLCNLEILYKSDISNLSQQERIFFEKLKK